MTYLSEQLIVTFEKLRLMVGLFSFLTDKVNKITGKEEHK